MLLPGCVRGLRTARVADSGSVALFEGSDASLSYDYSMEYVAGGVSDEVKDRINGWIVAHHILFDEAEEGAADVPAACRQWAEELVNSYRVDTEEFLHEFDGQETWIFNWEFSMNGTFESACPSRRLQTYCENYSEYTGGAHGMYAETYDVFDLRTGALVSEADLIAPGHEQEIEALLYESLVASLEPLAEEGEEGEPFMDSFFGAPTMNGNFSVSPDGITWHYNPYEIAPYAMGVIEVPLSWSQLKEYLL